MDHFAVARTHALPDRGAGFGTGLCYAPLSVTTLGLAAPGKEGEVVWQFTRAGEFHYACLIPGHMEAGMIAKITVK